MGDSAGMWTPTQELHQATRSAWRRLYMIEPEPPIETPERMVRERSMFQRVATKSKKLLMRFWV